MKLFGTDGIRGIPNKFPLDLATLTVLGQAIGHFCYKKNRAGKVCLARDTRKSGTFLSAAVSAGVLSEGVDIIDLGILPTPACAALLCSYGANAGIVISASHNPANDNGVKIFNSSGLKLSHAEESGIEEFVGSKVKQKEKTVNNEKDPGRAIHYSAGFDDYLSFLNETVPGLSLNNLKIVVDCSNGATEMAAPEIFKRLGADLVIINNKPDGLNINAGCGSENLEGAISRVKEVKADLGIVFDGDGDRVILIDENGNPVDGDHIMAFLAKDLQDRGQLPGNAIVCTDYSNKGLEFALKPFGINVIRGGIGDREVSAVMRELGHMLGGEQSGHIILSQLSTTGDGILTALQALRIIKEQNRTLSSLASIMVSLPQIILNIEVDRKLPLAKMKQTSQTISKAEADLAGAGRIYVRYSGTQNLLRIMVEGKNREEIKIIAETIGKKAQKEILEAETINS